MALQISTTRAESGLNSMLATINEAGGANAAGILRIYSGSPPASVATAVSGTLLAECTLVNGAVAAFAAAASLTAVGYVSTNWALDASINTTGTAGYFRLFQHNGSTAVMQGTVGTSGTDLILSSVSLISGGSLAITQFDISIQGIT